MKNICKKILKFNKILIVIFSILVVHSCEDDPFGVMESIIIRNNTKLPVHINHPIVTWDKVLLDSFLTYDSSMQRDEFYFCLPEKYNPKGSYTTAEFIKALEDFKIFYVNQEDSVYISNKFYEGKTFWEKEESMCSIAMLFQRRCITHTFTIT
jgi:hypothetical protein